MTLAPRAERPRRRAMLVLVPVSSMKTRCAGSSEPRLARHSSRAAATSGRSCSAACTVFFEADAVPVVEAPDRAHRDLETALAQPAPDLLERQVGLFADQTEQPIAVRRQRG